MATTPELGNVPSLAIDSGWTEPESAANTSYQPLYPYNDAKQTESGHLFEMDDTPTRERIRLQHGKSLTFFEMHPNGDQVHKVFGDDYEITIKNKCVLIQGRCSVTVMGDCNMEVRGDYNLDVKGDYYLQVAGKMKTRVKGDIRISGDEYVAITADENIGGTMYLGAADNITIGSDMNLKGSMDADGTITCDTLVADGTLQYDAVGNIIGGGGVFAGPFGFVSLTGGLSLGIPVAIPGSVFAVGSGTFGIKVFAPYVSSLYSSTIIGGAIWQSDILNYVKRLIHRPAGTGEIKATVA
jgi:hypothetical protein